MLILLFKIAKLVLSLSFPHTPPFQDPKILLRAIFRRSAKKNTHTKTTTQQKSQKQQQQKQQQQQQQLRRQQPASLRRLISVRRPGGVGSKL